MEGKNNLERDLKKYEGWRTSRPTPTQLAYIAGFVDGEGCITICNSPKTPSSKMHYNITLMIGNTKIESLKFIHNLYPASIRRASQKHRDERWKHYFNYSVYSTRAYILLKDIFPYLIIKRPQAEVCIYFWETRKSYTGARNERGDRFGPVAQAELFFREQCKQKIRELNRRGKTILTERLSFNPTEPSADSI